MLGHMMTDVATIGARPFIEWEHRGHGTSAIDVLPVLNMRTTWRLELARKISAYKSLPPNWNSYGSPAPTEDAVTQALDFVFSALKDTHIQPRTNPVSGGGIQMEWSKDMREFEIEFLPDGSIECLLVEDDADFSFSGRPASLDQVFTWLAGD